MCTMEPCDRKTYRSDAHRILTLLAATAEEQSDYLRTDQSDPINFGEHSLSDELALDFENVAGQATWRCNDGQISDAEKDTLLRIDAMFDVFSGPENASLWTVGALSFSNEWLEIRAIAAESLKLFERGD